jgi:hypothetical protein
MDGKSKAAFLLPAVADQLPLLHAPPDPDLAPHDSRGIEMVGGKTKALIAKPRDTV